MKTPRTDELAESIERVSQCGHVYWEMKSHAESLERELLELAAQTVVTIIQRDDAARLVRRLLRSHGEKCSRLSVNARSDAGLWLARYDKHSPDFQL